MSTATISEERLSSVEVAGLAGVSYRQLDYWVRMGVLRPSVSPAAGSGSQRQWSRNDAAVAAMVGRLARLGAQTLVLREAAAIACEVLDAGVTGLLLVIDATGSERALVSLERPDEIVEALTRMNGGVWAVPICPVSE